jgi:hypothetical protein
MEQHIQSAIDSPLLQRVSKVRERMGLEKLPLEILESELDPFLLHLLRGEGDDDPGLDANVTLENQQRYWLLFNKKWETWFDWQ